MRENLNIIKICGWLFKLQIRPNFQRESLICLIFTINLACKPIFRLFTLKLRQFAQKIRHFTVTIIRLFTVKIRPFTLKIMSFTLKNQD